MPRVAEAICILYTGTIICDRLQEKDMRFAQNLECEFTTSADSIKRAL